MTAARAATVSLVVAFAVLALKWVAYRLTGSVALYSDALESVVNVVAALAAVTALRIAALPPDESHPWGHSKAEYFSAGAEGVLIAFAAAATLLAAVPKLLHPAPIAAFGAGALASAGASVLNGVLGFWLQRMGRKLRSPALTADGAHVLSDVYTSGGVLVGVALAKLTGFWILDPLLACAVALNILWTGWHIVRSSVGGLMDEALPQADLRRIAGAVEGAMGEALEWHDLRARRAGTRLFVELHLVVASSMTVGASHAICDRIEGAVQEALPGSDVTIHVEPESERHGPPSGTDRVGER